MRYDLGDSIILEHAAPASATLTLDLTKPAGTVVTPTVTESPAGTFRSAAVTTDAAGVWRYAWTQTAPRAEITSGTFTVENPAPPGYVTLAELKESLNVRDTTRDDMLTRVIGAASRAIDSVCGRRFWLDPAATTLVHPTRGNTFPSGGRYVLIVPDIGDPSSIVISGRTVTTNAGADGTPVATRLYSDGAWTGDTVSITARFGWPYIPDEIAQATLLMASKLFKRKDSPEGVIASTEWGAIRVGRVDPDVQMLIGPYMIFGVA